MKLRKFFLRLTCLLLSLILLSGVLMASASDRDETVTILFTHDLHSHLLPADDTDGGEFGGFDRLYNLILQQRKKYAGTPLLTLDAGDFSMGSLFQTIYATDAAELRLLGYMGYDATTLGNHEFDFRASGLASMLNAAVDSGDSLPPIVQANYTTPVEDNPELTGAFDRYGIKDYIMVEKEGVRFAIFGVMGKDSHECAPLSGIAYQDQVQEAQRVVDEIQKNESYDYIICLSHAGTWDDPDQSEDEILATEVSDIDVIISGHTHTTLAEPIQVGETLIVSCGEYGKNLGVLRFNSAGLVSYELLAVDETVESEPGISAIIETYKATVSEHYLAEYDMEFDQVLATSGFDFAPTGGTHEDKALGNLITDSYIYAVQQAEGAAYEPVTATINAVGVIRDTLSAGDITVSDVFHVLSLGVGADGRSGYPLVSFYLYGSELKDGMEVDATVTALMPAAQLYTTGLYWNANTNRMLFNKVTSCGIVNADGTRAPLEDDKLYRVVCGLYCCQMLSIVEDSSFGILSITPRNADGSVVTDYDSLIIHDAEGNEVKEWYALASYIDAFEGEVVPESYRTARNEKNIYSSWNPIDLLKNPNLFTWLAILLVLLVALVIFLIVRKICRTVKKRKAKKAAAATAAEKSE